MTLIECTALIALGCWLVLVADRGRRWPGEICLPEASGGAPDDTPSIQAIVPARDEAALLAATLPGLLEQRGVDLAVLLVDDGSTDGTAAVARQAAESIGSPHRLQVLPAGPRPDGWSGKLHALNCGLQFLRQREAATGSPPSEWLLLTDADIRHYRKSVSKLWQRACDSSGDGPFDLVSIMARLHADTFWERLLLPPFVYFFQLIYPFRRVASSRSRVAAAAGGCVLIRRQALEQAGGFDALRDAIIDDIALARRVKDQGGSIWLGLDPGICSLRTYDRLADLWNMVARTAFTQLRHRWSLLGATLVTLTVTVVSPPLVIMAGAAELWIGAGGSSGSAQRAILWAALAWMLQTRDLLPAVRYQGAPLRFAAGLPAAGLLYGLMTATSAWRHLRGRGAQWKGRHYHSSRHASRQGGQRGSCRPGEPSR